MARTVEFDQEEAIQKALEVFWEKGYNGASMRDLTTAMQINPSSLYNTLGDKHQLFIQCVKHYTAQRRTLLEGRAAEYGSPLQALEGFIKDVAEVVIRDFQGCFAIKSAFELSPDDTAIRDLLKDDNNFTRRFLTGLLRKAVAAGELPSDTDPGLVADYIISTYTGWYELHILHRAPSKIRKLADFMIRQLLR